MEKAFSKEGCEIRQDRLQENKEGREEKKMRQKQKKDQKKQKTDMGKHGKWLITYGCDRVVFLSGLDE